ncbi:general stress protein [Paenibacillus sp. FSL R7-0048]|uniref:general stress protein n=1 Tax=Paenibacillus TaxID=44249 RepID=UPI00096F2CDA|nr:general stress protein [Paenibacillus odorifer]OMD87839.1 general stress protein [Paenibacillus odorifer]
MKKRLEKRLAYLYSGELFSLIGFVPISFLLNYEFPNLQLYSLYSFWISFIILEFLLLQGTIYWYVKLKRLRNENNSITPINVVRQLRYSKTLDIVMIMTTIVVFGFDLIKWYPSLPIGGLLISLFIYFFAILEFINYFYIQLSYDNVSDIKKLSKRRKLKKSCINKDLKRLRNWNSEN